MPSQLPIDHYFTKIPKRKAGTGLKSGKGKEKEPSPPKKRKVTHLPSPPLTGGTRQRTPSPVPPPLDPFPFRPTGEGSSLGPVRTPRKQKPAQVHNSPFKIPALPSRVPLDDAVDDTIVPSSQTQLLLLSPTTPRSIVPSSQTQLLSYHSPHRPKRLTLSSPRRRPEPKPLQSQSRRGGDEIVPSSQSQELELVISPSDPLGLSLPVWSQIRSCDDDVFVGTPSPRRSPETFIPPDDDGSETEPESDIEGAPPTSAPRTPHRVRKWYSESSSQPASVTSTPRRQRPLGQSVSMEAATVPDFVKDMNTMLAGSGSYPDDFPMSLREI